MFSFAQFGNDLYTGKRSFDFVGHRRIWYAIAVGVVVASVALLLLKGLNPSIEFRGGAEFQVTGISSADETVAERTVSEIVTGETPRATLIGQHTVRVQTERLSDEQTNALRGALAEAYQVSPDAVTSSFVGPSWGADVTGKALRALVIFLVLVGVVISLYFRTWKMAAGALTALLHDLVITVGIYALIGFEVSPATVIGFLTILGYSLYDTVVVFDKVRENTEHIMTSTRRTYSEAANLAINQTLVRSINTSVVASLPVAAILFIGAFLLGAGTLKDISLVLLIGIIVGTYSSVFLATPIFVDLRLREPEITAQEQRVLARRASEERRAAGEEPGAPAHAEAGAGGTATAVLERTETPETSSETNGTGVTGASDGSQPRRGPRNQPRRKPKGRRR
jgi:preprotein translocase subunit SecF